MQHSHAASDGSLGGDAGGKLGVERGSVHGVQRIRRGAGGRLVHDVVDQPHRCPTRLCASARAAATAGIVCRDDDVEGDAILRVQRVTQRRQVHCVWHGDVHNLEEAVDAARIDGWH